jgi:hypothetical protein
MPEMYTMRGVKFNAPAMQYLLRDPAGPTGRHLGRMGERIIVMARRLAGGIGTGRLSKSIRMRQSRVAGGQQLVVYSNVKYAYIVHEGTRPHVIDPKGLRIMVFNEAGRRVFASRVMHPGTRGKRYLTIPLEQVVRRG